VVQEMIRTNPQRRLIRPQEVAETVVWLCGPETDSITGLAIPIAGGEIM
jgi:NAD(P)-dependent dehydrogenase (short-subunit alcohol dehydrogenase family)